MTKTSISKGKIFEQDFKKSCEEQSLWIYRIKDNQLSYTTTFSTSQNPYDYLVFDGEVIFACECKATHLSYLTVSRDKDKDKDSKKMLKLHQINSLYKDNQYKNIIGVFILNFQTSGNTYLLPIENFMRWYNMSGKQSINEKEIQSLSPIVVSKELKRTRYRYDVIEAFQQLKSNQAQNVSELINS